MPSTFDRMFAPLDRYLGGVHGESVEYTFLDGHSVTDAKAFVDCIESGYEVDAGIRTSQPDRDQDGSRYDSKRTFGLRKSVIGESRPEIQARVRVVAEGDDADVWRLWRVIGNDAARWYFVCQKWQSHERSNGNFRSRA